MMITYILLLFTLSFQWIFGALSSKNIVEPYFRKKLHYEIGIILYKDFSLIDVIGPAEVLGNDIQTYTITTIADDLVGSRYNKLKVIPKINMKQAQGKNFDILVVPGSFKETYDKLEDQNLINNLKSIASKASTVLSIGTGSLLLAKTGLLDEKIATTTKQAYSILTPKFPKVKWIQKARWTHNQKFICASGVTASIDASHYIYSLSVGNNSAIVNSEGMEWEVNWDPENDPFFNIVDSKNPFIL